jgi:hypothetical protein
LNYICFLAEIFVIFVRSAPGGESARDAGLGQARVGGTPLLTKLRAASDIQRRIMPRLEKEPARWPRNLDHCRSFGQRGYVSMRAFGYQNADGPC